MDSPDDPGSPDWTETRPREGANPPEIEHSDAETDAEDDMGKEEEEPLTATPPLRQGALEGRGLPREITFAILSCLDGDKPTLRRLAQTNRAFRQLLDPPTWKTVHLHDKLKCDALQLHAFAQSLADNIEHVDVIHLAAPLQSTSSSGGVFVPRLFHPHDPTRSTRVSIALGRLHLADVQMKVCEADTGSLDDILQVLAGCPAGHAQSLWIDGTASRQHAYVFYKSSVLHFALAHKHTSILRLSYVDLGGARFLEILESMPNLKVLSIAGCEGYGKLDELRQATLPQLRVSALRVTQKSETSSSLGSDAAAFCQALLLSCSGTLRALKLAGRAALSVAKEVGQCKKLDYIVLLDAWLLKFYLVGLSGCSAQLIWPAMHKSGSSLEEHESFIKALSSVLTERPSSWSKLRWLGVRRGRGDDDPLFAWLQPALEKADSIWVKRGITRSAAKDAFKVCFRLRHMTFKPSDATLL